MAWGVKEGDAVFVSSFTFVASAEAPVLLGATPVFVDSDPDTYNMDPKDLQRAIDEVKKEGKLNLKAVVAVDIFGSPCDYDAIIKIAHDNGMKVLSDSCQSYGSVYKGKKPVQLPICPPRLSIRPNRSAATVTAVPYSAIPKKKTNWLNLAVFTV